MKNHRMIYNYIDYQDLYFTSHITPKKAEVLNLRPIQTFDPSNQEKIKKNYKYRFPIIFWQRKDGTKTPTIFCELTIDAYDQKVITDVKKASGETYAYFYCTELTQENKDKHKMLIQIHQIIHDEFKKLGIVHRKKKEKKQNADEERIRETSGSKMGDINSNKKRRRRKTSNKNIAK